MLYVYETTPRNRGWLCPWNGGIKQLDLQTVLRPLLLRAVYHIITSIMFLVDEYRQIFFFKVNFVIVTDLMVEGIIQILYLQEA